MAYQDINIKPHLRDGVDVYYTEDNDEIFFVYLASRKRIKIKCHSILVRTLAWLTGEHFFCELDKRFQLIRENLPEDSFYRFIQYLNEKGLLIQSNWIDNIELPLRYKNKLTKQLNFLLDLVGTVDEAEHVQKRIFDTKIAIFGIGAVGSWLCRELVMMGFRNFILVDYDKVAHSDISRHSSFNLDSIGKFKVDVVKTMIIGVDPEAVVKSFIQPLNIDTRLENLINDATFIINAADEPYIGYTSLKLSRYCLPKSLPLFIAGGFDAHLGCLGEIILPGITPCSDCYNNFFKNALADWKPLKHPVHERRDAFGGLVSFATFSASTAAMTILRYFINSDSSFVGGRGELLFDGYKIYSFNVERDPNCVMCGVNNEK